MCLYTVYKVAYTLSHKTVKCFLDVFYTKTRLSEGLLPDMKLIEKMFPIILDMKNANRAESFSRMVRKIESPTLISLPP